MTEARKALLRKLMKGAESHLTPFSAINDLPDGLSLEPERIVELAREAKSVVGYLLTSEVVGEVYFFMDLPGSCLFIVEILTGDPAPGVWVLVGGVVPLALYLVQDDTDLQAVHRATLALGSMAAGRVPIPLVATPPSARRLWKGREVDEKLAKRLLAFKRRLEDWLIDQVE